MKFSDRRFSLFFVFSLVFICLTAEAKAAVFTVKNLDDTGGGSLRQAINDVNNTAGVNVINFQTGLTGTIILGSPLPVLTKDVTINAPGADLLTVRRGGGDAYRIFHIASAVVINGLTIAGGLAPNTGEPKVSVGQGGGILNQGFLTLNNCRVADNIAFGSVTEGGGIRNTGFLIITNSEITNNAAIPIGNPAGWTRGTAIYNLGVLSIDNSTISGSSGYVQSFAIWNERLTTITNSSIINNATGGILSRLGFGGAPNDASSLLIENSTISGNAYMGIWHLSGLMQMRNITVTNNQQYGIIANGSLSRFYNSISAGNNGTDVANGFSADSSYNLIGKATSNNLVNGQNGNIVGTPEAPIDAQLAPLGNYGGRTLTHRLLHTSPAINAGNPTDFPVTDQRGVVRPVGGSSDIGAFEFNLTPHRILPKGGLNAAYNQTLTAFSNVPEPVFAFNVTEGALPPGLSLAPLETNAATLTGTATGTGTFNFTITATNAEGFTISASYSLTIQTAVSFAAVRGRVLTNDGKPVSRAFILLFDANGNVIKQAFTNPFGYYRFHGVQAGEIYGFKVVAKNRRFTPQQNVTINGELNDFNFTAEP